MFSATYSVEFYKNQIEMEKAAREVLNHVLSSNIVQKNESECMIQGIFSYGKI